MTPKKTAFSSREGASSENWRGLVADKLQSIDWKEALRDVSPFLERQQDAHLVSESIILPLLEKKGF